MNYFSVLRDSFKKCLNSLREVLEKCEETQLVINRDKCHSMVREGILIGHKISHVGLEVDLTKFDVVNKFLPPSV